MTLWTWLATKFDTSSTGFPRIEMVGSFNFCNLQFFAQNVSEKNVAPLLWDRWNRFQIQLNFEN